MNKVFKVIWSEARNAYVVVSEIAKNHGSKSCSTKKLLAMLIATGVMTCASVAPAMAANPAPNDTKIEVGKGASAVENSIAIGSGARTQNGTLEKGQSVALGSGALTGAKSTSIGSKAIGGREGATLVGANTNSAGLYSTVVGTDTVINTDNTAYEAKIDLEFITVKKDVIVQGAAATVVGSKNTVDNKNGKVYSGVANSVMGAANTIEGSNGVTIQGTGNKVTDAYKDMNITTDEGLAILGGNYSDLAKKQSGAVAVVGGANTVSKQTDSTVIGYDNQLIGGEENGSQNVFMAGSHNELNNVSDSLVMGNDNTISDKSNVISFGHGNKIEASNAVAIGNGASVSAEGGVALGVGSVADRANAVSVGNAKLNRQITNVAAGAVTADSTDAVNGAVATEASKHSKVVGGNNINVEETDVDGQKFYKVNMNKDIILGDLTGKYVNISGTNGTIETTGYIATKDRVYADKGGKLADIDVTGNKISNGASSIVLDGSNVKVNDKVTIDQNGKISGVAAGEVSSTSTDAINGSQLYQTNENVAQNKADIAQNKADIAQNKADIAQNKADIAQNKADIAQNKADIAQNKADIATNKADIATNKADIATNKANIAQNAADIKKVEALAKKHTTVTAGDNITVAETTNKDGGKEYKVALKEEIKLGSETTGQTVMNKDGLKVGDKVSVTKDAVTAGKTSISDEGVKVGDKTYISDKGLNANDQKVTNIAAGEISATSKDAVNGSQLYATNQEVANNTNRINQLGSRVNKVGAGAAALAALHPMDFDPDDKLTFSAGYGNYGGENAAAIGAYYRPDEKVMFSVGGTVGNGENMVNAGVSFSLDRTNHVSNSRTALAREVIDLRGQLAVMGAKMAKMEKAFGMLDETKTKLFPDIPANHWAYEYIAKLAGNGYIEGYPDGNFGGDRLMTRYEFAAMLYRAIENGAALEEKIIKEFEPELGRIRVDRISGEDGDRDKIERVRVNDTKGERDHYGNKLAK